MGAEPAGFTVTVPCQGPARVRTWGEEGLVVAREGSSLAIVAGGGATQGAGALLLAEGSGAAAALDGSFAAALVEDASDCATVLTDRVGSTRLFAAQVACGWVVSTSLGEVVEPGCPLDPAGIALVLANGAALNGRTLHAGVRSLERAGVHSISAAGIDSRPYWRYELTGEQSRRAPRELRSELAGLVRDSVLARDQSHAPPLLSLSAGLDSRAVLAVLGSRAREEPLACFSYAHGAAKRGSDATFGRELAARYGARHEIVESYRGDLPGVVRANAALGEGVANFCDEVDAWLELAARPQPAVFVGDECFGWVDAPLESTEDVLEVVGIRGWQAVAWLRPLLPADTSCRLEEGLEAELAALAARAPETDDLHDRKDFLYLDQRVAHVLMPWRECFAARLGPVQMPFLDRRILDFMRGVPSPLRRGKRLYREAIADAFPGLLATPTARRSGYLVNWNRELARHGPALAAGIVRTESRLDELIPPAAVLELLARRRGARAAARYGGKKVIDFAASRPGLAGRLARAAGARPLRRIDETTVLLRLLVLRQALARP